MDRSLCWVPLEPWSLRWWCCKGPRLSPLRGPVKNSIWTSRLQNRTKTLLPQLVRVCLSKNLKVGGKSGFFPVSTFYPYQSLSKNYMKMCFFLNITFSWVFLPNKTRKILEFNFFSIHWMHVFAKKNIFDCSILFFLHCKILQLLSITLLKEAKMITLSINRLSYAIFMLFSAYFDSDFTIPKQ